MCEAGIAGAKEIVWSGRSSRGPDGVVYRQCGAPAFFSSAVGRRGGGVELLPDTAIAYGSQNPG